jgi:hypothetical protein
MADTPALLVPIPVQALLLNTHVQNGVAFLRWTNIWQNLTKYTDPAPPPFGNVAPPTPADLGVHLHWTLPSALTHGTGKPDGSTEFKLLPNRWMVVRLTSGTGSTAPQAMKAWIVESDYANPNDGSTAWVDQSSKPDAVKFTRIGRSFEIGAWPGEPGGTPFLTATGIADVTFTAYQPGLTNVFGFHDKMTGVAYGTTVTYLVAGWYSRPGDDPLATNTPADLQWNVLGAAPGDAAPALSVYHGLVYDLVWQDSSIPPRVDSDATAMQIGVANTSIDALAAVLAAKAAGKPGIDPKELVLKLEAFQYGLIDMLSASDATAQLELKIRDAWFGATPGGTIWTLVPVGEAETTAAPLSRDVQPAAPQPKHAQREWVAELNRCQRVYDVAKRELLTRQSELFTLWWKAQRIANLTPAEIANQNNWGINITGAGSIGAAVNAELDPANASSFLSRVIAEKAAVDALFADLPNPAESDPSKPDSPQSWSKRMPDYDGTLALRAQSMPPFVHPVDPVVLIAGITPPVNPVDQGTPLPCRLATAATTGVSFAGNTVTRQAAAGVIQDPTAALGAKLAPLVAQAVSALAAEAFFADPNEAAAIANVIGVSDPSAIAALASAIANGTAQIATIADPLQAGFAFQLWQQAWSPLYIEWVITWKPSIDYTAPIGQSLPPPQLQFPANSGGAQDNWRFDPTDWTFDGSDDVSDRGSEYYTWAAPGDLSGWSNPTTYSGRTFLTPQSTLLFIKRLREYVKSHPGDPDLDELVTLIDAIGETQFLSQSLGGFNAQFVMQRMMQSLPPFGAQALVEAIGAEFRAIPNPALADQDFSFGGGTPFFMPLRGGYFQFEKLHIVDGFGQVLDLTQANGNPVGGPANFFPIRGAGTEPEQSSPLSTPKRLVKQAPRVVQPSRLDLRMLDAADDAKEIYLAADANPVCGWFLPNHLDHSISVYDAAGTPLGELLVLAQTAPPSPSVKWLPAPDSPIFITDPAQIANPHLRDALVAFTATGGGIPVADRVAAFRAFYTAIDETMGMVDPVGGQGDADLAVLIGRPLALVRAQVQFELFGAPAYNTSWRDTFDQVDPNDTSPTPAIRVGEETAEFTTIALPIRLGSVELHDDGLFGYWTADDYTRFNAVHASGATPPYVVPIVPDNYLALPFDYPKYTTVTLTLLIDPRGTVHATTGILPTTKLTVPPQFYADALEQMAVTFRIGPLLTDLQAIRMPFPAERNGIWNWIRATGPDQRKDFEVDDIIPADARARFAAKPPHLIDGWLKFTPKSKPKP